MMKEVSTRALGIWFGALQHKGIPLERMVEGTGISLATLRNKKERLDWAEFVAIMRNLRRYFTDEDYIEIGRSYFRSTGMQFAFVIARHLMTPMDFYRWMMKPQQGVGNQMFTCVAPTLREISETELEVDLEIAEPHEVYWDYFLPTVGNFEEMPRLLGCPPATVRLTKIPRGGRFHITVPKRTPIVTQIRRGITWPFTVRAAARELKDAHEMLQERYDQLEDARGRLDRQRSLLDTAYRIGQAVFGERDLATIGEIVTRSLVELAIIDGAHLTIGSEDRCVTAAAGRAGEEATAARVDLAGHTSGKLLAWPRGEDAESLLGLLAPTLALAVENAIAYRELAEYKQGLELLVEKRTLELRRASEQLAETIEQLRDAQNARERFFGNISHEIRTPLSLILLATADLEGRAGPALDPRGIADLGAINDSARKLLRLVDELLLLAAGDAQELELRCEAVDLGNAVATLAATWRPAAEAAQLELALEAPTSCVAVVDPVAFERMVTNLVSNAIKYTPPRGRVGIVLRTDGERIAIDVHDTGPGIADELRSRLFTRFARAQSSGKAGGSGIGLSLVKQLAEAHGGTVAQRPGAHGGSVFSIELPRTRAVAPRPGMAQLSPRLRPSDFGVPVAPTPAAPSTPTRSHGSILVVDDDPRLADMIANVLAGDFTVLVAYDGVTALKRAVEHQPHVLVTDVDMPGMDGIELARRFREATGDRLAPIVILSAIADLPTRLAGLEAGAIDYVVKPFDPRELLARVRAQFRMRDLALRLHRAEQLSALGTLAAGLAHEFRNPANGIVNAMTPLRRLLPRDALAPNQPASDLFEVVSGCAEQVAFLSQQLLSFRHPEGAIETRIATVSDLVQRAVMLAQSALQGLAIRERIEVGAIRCAPPLFTQVLTNLIENAGHAAGHGGWIEIVARAHAGALIVEVSDSGPGVPHELRDRVFEPFFTTKAPGVATGLGLPLARDIVHRHGGVLEIRDRGLRPAFVIELPNAVSEA